VDGPATPGAPGAAAVLRAVTWNVHHGVGTDGRLDLGRVASGLAGLAPDVAGLQELDRRFGPRSDHADQPARLADALGLHLLRGPALSRGGGEYGVALLTRDPARPAALHRLPGRPGAEPRVALEAVLDAGPAAGLRVVVTHLEPRDAGLRREQAAALAALAGPGPAVLLADLNARPDSRGLAPLPTAWRDAWVAHRGRWRSRAGGATHPGRPGRRRIDGVLLAGPVEPVAVRVVPLPGSDHRPVVADLRITGG